MGDGICVLAVAILMLSHDADKLGGGLFAIATSLLHLAERGC